MNKTENVAIRISSAYNTAHRHFQSWDDFAKSYVIGVSSGVVPAPTTDWYR
jgi:hypothetical protein